MKSRIKLLMTTLFLLSINFSCEENKDILIPEFSSKLISYNDCGTKNKKIMASNETCINYTYSASEKTLIIEHINAGFNCCPDSLFCDATLTNNLIVITESEIYGSDGYSCSCQCLYDLTIELTGIMPDYYQFTFIEPYVGDQEELCFDIDLTLENTGSLCISRRKYPWRPWS